MLEDVSPFIGIEAGGSCLVGPYLPLGMVRPGPDMKHAEDSRFPNNGWKKGAPIRRFSQVHVSGTGGSGRYQNISLSPYLGERSFEYPSHDFTDERASPGYASFRLKPQNILAELTCTARVGVQRFTFPPGHGQSARVLVDASAAIRGFSTQPLEGHIRFADRQRAYGFVTLLGGWGHDHPFNIFFFLEFDQEALGTSGIMASDPNCGHETHTSHGADLRVDCDFGNAAEVEARVGISFVSVAQARRNLQRETSGKNFEEIRAEAEAAWRDQLARVRVEGGSKEDTILHYSMLYRLLAMPGDLGVDDEFPLWHSGQRQFNDFFCLWDSCRNANAFLGLAYAPLERDIVNCLIDVGQNTGWLFDAWISFHHGFQQGGCSADILLSEAILRKLPGIDYQEGLRLARKHFEIEPEDPSRRGRYLREWQEVGYVSTKLSERQVGCVSRHIEYTYHDWCIGRLAQALGDHETARICYENAARVMTLWHPEKRCFYPKNHDGTWAPDYDFRQIYPGVNHAMDPYFFEGTGVEWSLCPLAVIDQIIAGHGGSEAFIAHLDDFFASNLRKWKEIILHTPYLYHYAGRPDKSADQVRVQRRRYHTGRDGIADNEDMGSNSTFVMATGLGLYPVMGQAIYLLSPPRFRKAELMVGMDEDDSRLCIETSGADPQSDHVFIASAKLNGQPLDRAWVRHEELVKPGKTIRLELTLAEIPTDWGTEQKPPAALPEAWAELKNGVN